MKRVIRGLKRIFSKSLSIRRKREITSTPVTLKDIKPAQQKAFERDRAYHRALLAKEQAENAKLRRALKKLTEPNGEEDPAIVLNEQLKEMDRERR